MGITSNPSSGGPADAGPPATVTVTGSESLVGAIIGKPEPKHQRWISPEQFVTAIVSIVAIVTTGGITYCTQSSARHDDLLNTEWIEARRLETTTLDSLYVRLGQELRATSDRRNAMIGRYQQLDTAELDKRIAESNRIDDAWRDQESLWDLRIRRYVDTAAIPAWDTALATVGTYGKCVENQYGAWMRAGYRYRADSACVADSSRAVKAVADFRDAAVNAYRRATPPTFRKR